jgi:hypothetical protein
MCPVIASFEKNPAKAENPEARPPIIPVSNKTIIQFIELSGKFNMVPTRLAKIFSLGIV